MRCGEPTCPIRPALDIGPVPDRRPTQREDGRREIGKPPAPLIHDLRAGHLQAPCDLLSADQEVDVHHAAHDR